MNQPIYEPTDHTITLRDAVVSVNEHGVSPRSQAYDAQGVADLIACLQMAQRITKLEALAAQVEVDEDENGAHFRLGAFSRTVSASFALEPVYGLRWVVDCESPGEAEADAIVALLAAAYARKMQKERPTL